MCVLRKRLRRFCPTLLRLVDDRSCQALPQACDPTPCAACRPAGRNKGGGVGRRPAPEDIRPEGLQVAQGPSGSDETCDQTQDLVQDIGQRTEKAPHSRSFLMQSRNGAPTSQPPAPSPGTSSNSPTRSTEARHVGKGWVRTCRSRVSADPL